MSRWPADLWASWVAFSPWFYGIAAILTAVALIAAAVIAQLWPLGVLALLLLALGVWNLSTGIRIWRAQQRGASPVSPLIPHGSVAGAGFAVSAAQTDADRTRSGMVVIVDGIAAFVPLTEWQSLAGGTLAAVAYLRVSKIAMLDMPQSVDELRALVETHQGLWLDQAWAWSMPGRMLIRTTPPSMVSVRLREPHARLWAARPLDEGAAALLKKLLAVGVILALVLVGGGGVAWQVTGDPEYLQAGIGYAVLLVILGLGVAYQMGKLPGR